MDTALSEDARPDAAPRPGAARVVADLRKQVEQGQVDTVLLTVPGITGRLRGKAYDAGHFLDEVVEHGSHAAGYLLSTDVDMRMLPGYGFGGWEHGAGDIRLRPDLGTLRTAGWLERTALVLANACDRGGRWIPVAPREVLARQLGRLAELGLAASLGVESEASTFAIAFGDAARRGYRDLPPTADHNTDYALTHPGPLDTLIALIRRTARASGLPLEAVKTEAGAGQLEVTFRHTDPVAAADNHMVYKELAYAAAQSAAMALTFMAKPFTGQDGNSCHLHLSLTKDGTNLLVDEQGRLTETGRHAVAGCMAVLDELAVLMLPTVNSYKRLHADPPLFAPKTLTYGYDNRTCALRVLGKGRSGRIECRIPGGDAQPHLAAAALLAAVVHGIVQRLALHEEPVTGSAYGDAHATILPRSLDDAIERLRTSQTAADLLGPDVVAHYLMAARHEAQFHRARVTDLERERGFARA